MRSAVLLAAIQRLALTLWVGALFTSGLLVAPLLFATLDDRALAGTIAGGVFAATARLGLGCGLVLLLTFRLSGQSTRWRTWVTGIMLVLVALGHFVLAPQIAGLRETGLADSAQFARLHGFAGVLFLVTTALGFVLVAAGVNGKDDSKASR